LAVLLSACASWTDAPQQPWSGTLARSCNRNPTQASRATFIAKPTWAGVNVAGKPMEQFLSTLNEKQRASFESDLQALAENYLKGIATAKANQVGLKYEPLPVTLADAPSSDLATVSLRIVSMSPGNGWSFGLINTSSETAFVVYEVEVADASGACEAFPGRQELAGGYGSGDRLRAFGYMVASEVTAYLRTRYWAGRTPQPVR
jgi:hypothetical protein